MKGGPVGAVGRPPGRRIQPPSRAVPPPVPPLLKELSPNPYIPAIVRQPMQLRNMRMRDKYTEEVFLIR